MVNVFSYQPTGCTAAQAPSPTSATDMFVYKQSTILPQSQHYLTPQYVVYPNTFFYGVPPPQQTPVVQPAQFPKGSAQNPHVWLGDTKEEVDRQNMVIAQNMGATKPASLAPQGATNAQTWWCRELDGSYTLRNTNTIQEALQPGYWAFAQQGGYPYFIRQKPA